MAAQRVLLAMTGATGMLYVLALLDLFNRTGVTVDAVISECGVKVLKLELDMAPEELTGVSSWFAAADFTAPPASGSASYDAMVILPCTTGTMAAIAAGYSANLIHRAADVCLKERRLLLLAVRETPLNRTHLTNMLALHDAGAIICPPMPSFYLHPDGLDAMALQFAGRICDQIGVHVDGLARWNGV